MNDKKQKLSINNIDNLESVMKSNIFTLNVKNLRKSCKKEVLLKIKNELGSEELKELLSISDGIKIISLKLNKVEFVTIFGFVDNNDFDELKVSLDIQSFYKFFIKTGFLEMDEKYIKLFKELFDKDVKKNEKLKKKKIVNRVKKLLENILKNSNKKSSNN